MTDKKKPTGLALLCEGFPDHLISKLPKPTRAQTDAVKQDFRKGIRCKLCGGWHHPDVVHLDYVGHAALTSRLLDADPEWNWEPVTATDTGVPLFDDHGGMWIKLTVCGVSRLGYGHADGKRGGDAVKETIGDAMRNAAMRFGAALDLWHKGDLHANAGDDPEQSEGDNPKPEPETGEKPTGVSIAAAGRLMDDAVSLDDLRSKWKAIGKALQTVPEVADAKERRKTQLAAQEKPDALQELLDDDIAY